MFNTRTLQILTISNRFLDATIKKANEATSTAGLVEVIKLSFPLYIIQKGMSIPSITFQEKHHLLAMFVHLMIPKVASTLVFNVILLSIEDVSTCHTSYEYLVTTTVFLLPVLFLSEILGFAEFVAERWMKTMDHILAQRIAPMQCTLTVLLCSMYGLVKNSRAKQSWKMTILSRRLRRWMMGLYDILGMRTIA
ncbi:uncharacterized protein LOC108825903 isoform X2 [Raphanus sativus]|uniref:Uncharacterized protein LOC108825903 isoform X2 n=1 Tax=Raphanus sativus TaxID=3726 RepID=A0A9W3CG75_RAPSA|nr:uncharacterized protein LOC108825903 isoform X2 [Raphanus sativus]